MSIAGVITYKVNQDGSLDSRWSHPDVKGMTGTERAKGGTPGTICGKYDVEIFDPESSAIFRGSLEIEPLGKAFSLAWAGHNLPEGSQLSKYSGIGLMESDHSLVACFQESV